MASNNVDLTLKVNMKSDVNKELKKLESSVIRTVGAITAAIATIQAVLFPVTNAIAFERAMADVAKTTGYNTDQIDSLSTALNNMSKELGITAVELANVAAIAGQLGLGDQGLEAIEKFTASVARASVTLGLSVEKTAEGGAQLAAIFGKSVAEIEKVFATINELSNNSVAAGGDLIDIMKRVGTTAGTSFEQVAALAASVRQLGVPNEQAGTGLVKYLGNLLAESKKFSIAMELTQNEWVNKVKTNSVDALKYVLTKLSQAGAAEQSALIKKLFGSGRLFALGDKLVGDAEQGFRTLDKMLGLATEGYREGTSSVNEYNRIMETTAKRLDVLKESFVSLGIKAGNQALPAIQRLADKLANSLQDEEVIAYFEKLGSKLGDFIDWMSKAGTTINEWVDSWENLLVYLKIFIGYKIGAMLAGWAIKMGFVIVAFRAFIAQLIAANALLASLHSQFVAMAVASRAAGGVVPFAKISKGADAATKSTKALGKVMKGLGTIFRAFTGIAGLALLLVGSVIIEHRDAILEWIGWTDAAVLEQKRKREKDERERQAGINKSIAEAREAKNRIEAITAVIPVSAEIRLELNEEDTKKNIEELISNTVDLVDLEEKSGSGVVASAERVKDLGEDMREEYNKVLELQEKIATLEAGRPEVNRRGRATGGSIVDEESLKEARTDLERQNTVYEKSIEKVEKLSRTSNEFYDTSSKASDGLERNNQNLINTFSTFEQKYAELVLNSKNAADNTAFYRQELIKLQNIQEGIKGDDLNTPESDKRLDDIEYLKTLVDESKTASAEFAKAAALYNKIELTAAEREDTASFLGTSTEDLTKFVKQLNSLETENVDKTTQGLLKTKDAIIFNYLYLTKVEDGYKRMSKAAEDYKKRAASALNNVNNEIVALRLGMEKFGRDLKNSLVDRKIDLKLDVKLDELDDELQQAKDKIDKYYDSLESRQRASGLIAGRFSTFSLDGARDKDKSKLEDEYARKRAALEAKTALEKYNNELERSKKLAEEAGEAAAAGNFEEFFALKDESKKALADAKDLIKDMSEIQTVDVFGKDAFKFNDVQIDKLLQDTKKVASTLEEAVLKTVTTMSEKSIATSKVYSDLLKTATDNAAGAKNVFDKLSKQEGIDERVVIVTKLFKEATEGLGVTLDKFTSQSFKPFEAVNNLDVAKLAKDISAALEAGALDAFTKAAGKVEFADPRETISGRKSTDTGVDVKFNIDTQKISQDTADQMKLAVDRKFAGEPVPVTIKTEALSLDEATAAVINSEFRELTKDVTIAPGLDDTRVLEALNDAKVTITPDADTKEVKKAVEDEQYVLDNLLLKIDGKDIEIVNKEALEAKLLINLPSSATPLQRAAGGPVFGAGTATSDSIPAWLSNGEWVIDAFTTNFFGGSFFANLQAMARGRGSISKMKEGMPAFADGGLVSSIAGSLGGSNAQGTRDSVDLNFNIGNNSFQVSGEREQVEGLVSAMKYITG